MLVVLAVLLNAGCGGGEAPTTPAPPSGTNPPPTQPPPARVASSLELVAGNGQEALPGQPVPVLPTVRVLDQQQAALAGVSVAFSVDSGGGTVGAALVTTGADGTAATSWTLGPLEASNSLRATVSGLPPLTISARARFPEVRIRDTTITAAGGSLRYTQPGDPLSGLTLTIPAGAFPQGGTWQVRAEPASVPAIPSVSLAAPPFRIETSQGGEAAQFLTLRIPVRVPAGEFAGAFYWDPVVGHLEAIPTVDADSTSITVAMQHVSASRLLSPATAPGARRVSRAFASASGSGGVSIVLLKSSLARLRQPVSTGFQPGVDDWEFANWGSYISPAGHCAGQSITAVWYYLRQKAVRGALHAQYDEIHSGFYWDNPRGYRFASTVQESIDWSRRASTLQGLESFAQAVGIGIDSLHFFTGALAMLATGHPQYVAVRNARGGHALVAWASTGSGFKIADPNWPGQARQVAFTGGRFTPYDGAASAAAGGSGTLYETIRVLGVSAVIPVTDIDPLWPAFLDGTIGSSRFPAYRVELYDPDSDSWSVAPDTIVTRQQDLKLRAVCPSCMKSDNSPGAAAGQQLLGIVDSVGNLRETVTTGGTETRLQKGKQRLGLKVYGADTSGEATFYWTWLDFRWITVDAKPFFINPDSLVGKIDTTYRFVARPSGGAPPNATYEWDFGDGHAPVLVTGGDSTVQYEWKEEGSYTVSVRMMNPQTGLQVARATTPALIGSAVLRWRLTSVTGPTTGTPPAATDTKAMFQADLAFFSGLMANPASGVLRADVRAAGTGGISLAFIRNGVGAQDSVATQAALTCDVTHSWNWTGDAVSGTLSGRYVRKCANFSNGTIALAWTEIFATKDGDQISGQVTGAYRDYTVKVTQLQSPPKTVLEYQHVGDRSLTWTFTGVRQP